MYIDIYKELQEKKEYLQNLIKKISDEIESEPVGHIRIKEKRNKHIEYYFLSPESVKKEQYISCKDSTLISSLLQKRYNHLVLREAEAQLDAIKHFLISYNPNAVAIQLNKFRKDCINHIKVYEYPDNEFFHIWQQKKYKGNDYPISSDFITNKGEKVRSKSELIIANCLNDAGVPYRYEYPYTSSTFQRMYPDFTVLNIRTREEYIWEHFGRIDSEDYRNNLFKKLSLYAIDGFYPGKGMIVTFEDYRNPLSVKMVKKQIEAFLL